MFLRDFVGAVAKIFNRNTGDLVASSFLLLDPLSISELSVLKLLCLLTALAAFSFFFHQALSCIQPFSELFSALVESDRLA